jgi:predicted signal transduction protein with EAL and GGDEF domain
VVARLGGDEFAALVEGAPTDAAGAALARAVVLHLGEIVTRSGRTLNAGASVGIAHHPRDGRTRAELQAHADLALYAAKSEGRGTWRPFVEAMHQKAQTRREIERDLPEALETGAIQAWFQPQIACATGRVVGFEALLRWKHPSLGWIAPPDAIAAAAATRRSRDLTRAILRDACAMVQALQANAHPDAIVSINVSPNEFGTYPIAELIAAELDAHRLPASRLAIEITEEAVYSNERGGKDVDALSAMGVGIIVDDFGVAYSSIGSLRALRFDSLKVDRSFIRDIAESAQDRILLEAILAFARTLGVTVVAEGVETRVQFEILRQLGCPVVQGYHFARAMPRIEALAWISGNDDRAGIAVQDRIGASLESVKRRSGARG